MTGSSTAVLVVVILQACAQVAEEAGITICCVGAEFAFQEQSLALGAAQVLYLYAWFTRTRHVMLDHPCICAADSRTGEIMRENIVLSAQLPGRRSFFQP